jgi:hypothetical protein
MYSIPYIKVMRLMGKTYSKHKDERCIKINKYCDVDGATGSRGHENSAFSRVSSHTPTPSIIMQRSVNTPPHWAVTSCNNC